MDTLGPVSVLDSGRRSRDAVITDRLTRRRSPERPRLKASRSDMDVVYRIPQPYRTSFSARQSVERLNVSDRSRSLSPTSSLRSFQSSRSERVGRVRHVRAKSPKRVTYDTRVTVRHSDTDDSMFTELSSRDLESSPSHLVKSDFLHMNTSVQSKDSGLDYSLQLRDLSHQILKMDWSTQDKDRLDASFIGSSQDHSPVTGTSLHGILKESQNSRQNLSEPGFGSSPTHGPLHITLSHQGDKENALSADDHVTIQPQAHVSAVASLRDSQYERSHSYRKAITDHYSSEVKALVDAGVEEKAQPVAGNRENGGLVAQQRCSSVSAVSKSCTNTSNQLTPAKRSVSTSISNFFRRISPRLGRKPAKSATPSGPKSASSQSLPAASDVSLDQDNTNPVSHNPIPQDSSSSQLSRNRIRKSFLKLIGGQHKEVKSKVESPLSADSPQSTDLSSPDSLMDDQHANQKDSSQGEIKPQGGLPQSSQRLLKSIETTNLGKKDVYREFKDKRLPHSTNTDSELEERYRAIKAQYGGPYRPSESHEMLESCKSQQHKSATSQTSVAKTAAREITDDTRPTTDFQENPFRELSDKETVSDEKVDGGARLSKAEPPRSLNVIPPRSVRLLQASTISTISGDESIGECSLDFNLTASEPSLLSGTSHSAGSNLSKKIVLSHSLFSSNESQVQSDVASTTDSVSTPQHHHKDALLLGQELAESCLRYSDKENASPLSPTETAHKPSYLKLSCAVSGYGKYSRYSSYKNIPTRSPFSSTLSLRSDISSPDSSMPSFKSPKEPAQGHLQATLNSMAEAHHNGQSCLPLTLNGHTMQDAGHYPTGNPVKDGEYFLSLTAMEEEQLRQQASQAEAMMRSQDLPEEVNGRVRAAIGKSNLLINQKFEQFRELCQQHMHQDPTDRVPLWEDLQGFWDMIKIQVDNVEDMFAEIQHMSENGWKEIPKQPSRRSSASSSPKSGSLSQTSTPSATPGHTPGSKRKGLKPNNKDTPDSSPERTQKARSTAKARDEARKKLLAEKRAAMKQQQQEAGDIEIYVPETK